jgi:hypothetical protein
LWIFLPQYFFLLFCCESFMETLSVNRFQSNLFYILHDIRLSSMFLWTFFFQCGLLCLFFVDFFFSTRCQYYMNYWTHTPFNCWQSKPV